MFRLIIDSAAGLATKPQGADNSTINLFSLATAPPVCVKIVLHLIRMQFSSCISITEVSESVLLIPRPWPGPGVSPWSVTTLRADRIVYHKEEGLSKNNSASSSHSSSKLYCRLSQSLISKSGCTMRSCSQQINCFSVEYQGAEALSVCVPGYGYLIWCLTRHKVLLIGSGLPINSRFSQPRPAIWL